MKIKPAPRKKKVNTKLYHHWLAEEKPRSRGRLSQLSKKNKKMRSLYYVPREEE